MTGGVDGTTSSGLASCSLSEHNEGVGASVTEDDCHRDNDACLEVVVVTELSVTEGGGSVSD